MTISAISRIFRGAYARQLGLLKAWETYDALSRNGEHRRPAEPAQLPQPPEKPQRAIDRPTRGSDTFMASNFGTDRDERFKRVSLGVTTNVQSPPANEGAGLGIARIDADTPATIPPPTSSVPGGRRQAARQRTAFLHRFYGISRPAARIMRGWPLGL